MDYWSVIFYKANNKRAATILDKVKKGVWLFLKDEYIVRKGNCFLHKFGVLSWESRYKNPTPCRSWRRINHFETYFRCSRKI